MGINFEKLAAAQESLYEKVYVPAFFAKMAEFGVAPETEEQAVELLEIAAKAKLAGVEAEPSDATKIIKSANLALDKVLGTDQTINQLSEQFVPDSEIKQALAALKEAAK